MAQGCIAHSEEPGHEAKARSGFFPPHIKLGITVHPTSEPFGHNCGPRASSFSLSLAFSYTTSTKDGTWILLAPGAGALDLCSQNTIPGPFLCSLMELLALLAPSQGLSAASLVPTCCKLEQEKPLSSLTSSPVLCPAHPMGGKGPNTDHVGLLPER